MFAYLHPRRPGARLDRIKNYPASPISRTVLATSAMNGAGGHTKTSHSRASAPSRAAAPTSAAKVFAASRVVGLSFQFPRHDGSPRRRTARARAGTPRERRHLRHASFERRHRVVSSDDTVTIRRGSRRRRVFIRFQPPVVEQSRARVGASPSSSARGRGREECARRARRRREHDERSDGSRARVCGRKMGRGDRVEILGTESKRAEREMRARVQSLHARRYTDAMSITPR